MIGDYYIAREDGDGDFTFYLRAVNERLTDANMVWVRESIYRKPRLYKTRLRAELKASQYRGAFVAAEVGRLEPGDEVMWQDRRREVAHVITEFNENAWCWFATVYLRGGGRIERRLTKLIRLAPMKED